MRAIQKFRAISLLALTANGCTWLGGPMGPVVAAPTPTPACAYTNLGAVICGATSPGILIIRDAATWAAFASNATCATNTAAPVNFASQMIIVSTTINGASDPRTSQQFSSACLSASSLDVGLTISYQSAIGAPMKAGPCLCENLAIAVPNTLLPVNVNQCKDGWHFNTLNSHVCAVTTY